MQHLEALTKVRQERDLMEEQEKVGGLRAVHFQAPSSSAL